MTRFRGTCTMLLEYILQLEHRASPTHRSNMEDSDGWNRYWYERTDVPQAAQIRRSLSETVSQVPTLRRCCRPAGALQVVVPGILSCSESPGAAVPAKLGPAQAGSRVHTEPALHRDGESLAPGTDRA